MSAFDRANLAPRVAVFGLGNLLRCDDAFGPEVIRRLEALDVLPPDVRVGDLGTPGLDLASHVAGFDLVVLVDTVLVERPPGTLVRLGKADLMPPRDPDAPPRPRMTMHDAGIEDALALAELSGNPVANVVLIAVVPACVEQGVGLSPPVADAIDGAIAMVRATLASHVQTSLAAS